MCACYVCICMYRFRKFIYYSFFFFLLAFFLAVYDRFDSSKLEVFLESTAIRSSSFKKEKSEKLHSRAAERKAFDDTKY